MGPVSTKNHGAGDAVVVLNPKDRGRTAQCSKALKDRDSTQAVPANDIRSSADAVRGVIRFPLAESRRIPRFPFLPKTIFFVRSRSNRIYSNASVASCSQRILPLRWLPPKSFPLRQPDSRIQIPGRGSPTLDLRLKQPVLFAHMWYGIPILEHAPRLA